MSSQPIRWDNVSGPSLADASRPLESAQRAFSGLFDGLQGTVKDYEAGKEKIWEQGKAKNSNAFMDVLAGYQDPATLKADIESGKLGQLKAGYGDQIDHNAVRLAAEARLHTLMGNQKENWQFANDTRDHNEEGQIDAIKAKLASNDPAIRAQGEQEAAAAQVRKRADLVAAATQANHAGLEWDQTKQEWVRKQGKYEDDLKTSANQRQTSMMQAQASQVSAKAAADQVVVAGRNATNAERNTDSMILDRIQSAKEKATEQGIDLNGRIAKTAAYSPNSQEGALAVAAARAKLGTDPTTQSMAGTLIDKLIKDGHNVGTIELGLAALRPERWFDTESGNINEAYKAATASAIKNPDQAKVAKTIIGNYVTQGDALKASTKATEDRFLSLMSNRGSAGTPPTPLPPGSAPVQEAAAPAPQAAPAAVAPVVAPPTAPADPLQVAKDRLEQSRAAAKGKGYYDPETQNLIKAEGDYKDMVKQRTTETREAQAKLSTAETTVKSLESQVRSWTKTNPNKEPPAALIDVLNRNKADLEVLRGRAEDAKKLLTR